MNTPLANTPSQPQQDADRNAAYQYWLWMKEKKLWMAPEWVESFPLFYEHVGPRPGTAQLKRIAEERAFAQGNVRWVGGKRAARGGTRGPARKLSDAEVRETLDLAYTERLTVPQIMAMMGAKLTKQDAYDIIAGRRYRIADFDYTNASVARLRTPSTSRDDILRRYAAGVTPAALAEKYGMSEPRMLALLARLVK